MFCISISDAHPGKKNWSILAIYLSLTAFFSPCLKRLERCDVIPFVLVSFPIEFS